MKYIDLKRFKFVTILKKINFNNVYTILLKKINFKNIYSIVIKKLNFKNIYNIILKKLSFINIYNTILKKFNFNAIYKSIIIKKNNFIRLFKFIRNKKYKYNVAYFFVFIFLSIFIYLSIPYFYDYNKLKIKNLICKEYNLECEINGKIKYSFYPSPRIKLNNIIIKNSINKYYPLAKIQEIIIKLPVTNLVNKDKFKYNKIKLKNATINLNVNKIFEYKDFFKKKKKPKLITAKKAKVNFFEKKNNIATIEDTNFKYILNDKKEKGYLNGNFLGDKINIKFKTANSAKNKTKVYELEFLESKLFTKVEIFDSPTDKNFSNGNVYFKFNKNKVNGIFNYKDNNINFKNATLRNDILDGKFNGNIQILPYLDFNLNMDLSSLNFNRLYNYLTNLQEINRKNLFKINKKINGKINLFINKIFSKNNLIDSLESRVKFINGNILIDQLLLNMGKLGAADITGIITNEKKYSNFKFEKNLFIDDLKFFYRKFGVYNKQKVSSNLYVSGNFNLTDLTLHLHEIYNEEKFKNEDILYIEKEFNYLLLDKKYESLFDFKKFKEFIKLVSSEEN